MVMVFLLMSALLSCTKAVNQEKEMKINAPEEIKIILPDAGVLTEIMQTLKIEEPEIKIETVHKLKKESEAFSLGRWRIWKVKKAITIQNTGILKPKLDLSQIQIDINPESKTVHFYNIKEEVKKETKKKILNKKDEWFYRLETENELQKAKAKLEKKMAEVNPLQACHEKLISTFLLISKLKYDYNYEEYRFIINGNDVLAQQ